MTAELLPSLHSISFHLRCTSRLFHSPAIPFYFLFAIFIHYPLELFCYHHEFFDLLALFDSNLPTFCGLEHVLESIGTEHDQKRRSLNSVIERTKHTSTHFVIALNASPCLIFLSPLAIFQISHSLKHERSHYYLLYHSPFSILPYAHPTVTSFRTTSFIDCCKLCFDSDRHRFTHLEFPSRALCFDSFFNSLNRSVLHIFLPREVLWIDVTGDQV